MQALGAEDDGSKGRIVLTAEGEQEMTTLWSKKELLEIVPWEQVQIMARQARRERLNHRQEDEAGLQVAEMAGLSCSLCMTPVASQIGGVHRGRWCVVSALIKRRADRDGI